MTEQGSAEFTQSGCRECVRTTEATRPGELVAMAADAGQVEAHLIELQLVCTQ